MKLKTLLQSLVMFVVASLMLVIGLASAGNAWDTEQGYTAVQNGEGHCANGPAGPSSQTRIAIRPKEFPAPAISVLSGDMTQQGNITGTPQAWILHLIGSPSLESGHVVISVDGQEFDIPVTISNRAQCGDVPPPPPESITVCRDGETITILVTELVEGDVEGECPIVPPEVPETPETPVTPEVPVVVPPVTVTATPTPAPVAPPAEVSTPPALAFTGAAETAGLAALGTVLTLLGLFLVRGRKTQRGLVR